MNKLFSAGILIMFACGAVLLPACGKGDRVKLIETKKKYAGFIKTREYRKMMGDTPALGRKMEEFAKSSGFRDFMEYIDAWSRYMSDPEVSKIEAEIMKLSDSLKQEDGSTGPAHIRRQPQP